jgi:hypothetical protein
MHPLHICRSSYYFKIVSIEAFMGQSGGQLQFTASPCTPHPAQMSGGRRAKKNTVSHQQIYCNYSITLEKILLNLNIKVSDNKTNLNCIYREFHNFTSQLVMYHSLIKLSAECTSPGKVRKIVTLLSHPSIHSFRPTRSCPVCASMLASVPAESTSPHPCQLQARCASQSGRQSYCYGRPPLL